MTTHYSILTSSQIEIIDTLRALPSLGFVLYGGTAIALQIGHRRSNDFDFFSCGDIDKNILYNAAPLIRDSITIQDDINTWTIQVYTDGGRTRPVKLSFFGGLDFGRIGTPVKTERGELLMASLDDLLGHKLKTLLQRTELRDYQDIAALIRAGYGLDRGLAAASALFKGFPAAEAMRALTYFKGGDVHLLSQEDKSQIIEQVRLTREFNPLPLLANTLV